ncbi:tRNA (N(6)-L-threonylcarbamoyladenosine(37)-C(2))-methylthiotransferase MtaB [bacterium]|nr:MAG: tRNA (N(6)-L-threonylcarbamoyladenosine(37)-C(2))-methylthiotransferase MtaB [bacterium]
MSDLPQPIALAPLPAVEDPDGTPLRVAFRTLGCRLNQYDTEGIRTALAHFRPLQVVQWDEQADLYVLNSCTVTGKADQECRRLARQAKRRHGPAKVVVVGCYAQTQPDQLAAIDEIDAVVGNTVKDDVANWLPAVMGSEQATVQVEEFDENAVFDSPLISEFSGRSRAFVKVQDGCNLRCTYCLIWQARGPGRSRAHRDVLSQLRVLVDAGYNETILAGIHLGGYGRDLTPRLPLTDLLESCLREFPALRIRLSSIHPNEVTPGLLELFARHERLRPHLHISLQSGSSSVLARMKRPYRGQRAWEAMRQVAAVSPDFGIGADIIVGFPGETDAEFAETRRLVEESPFSYLHVFRYSRRPGTVAATMADQVHTETITERSAVLRGLARAKERAFALAMVGQRREAVVEAAGTGTAAGWRHATTDNYVTVLVPEGLDEGSLAQVSITDFNDGRLTGRAVAGEC